MVGQMGPIVLTSLADGVINDQRICDELLGACKTPHIKELDLDAYVQRVLSTKPESLKNNDYVNNLYA